MLSNDEVRNPSNLVQTRKANPIQSQVELYRRLKGLVNGDLLASLLQREEVRQENAVWVSSQLEFAQKKEAKEVVELEKMMSELKGPGVRVGNVDESEVGDAKMGVAEVEIEGNQFGQRRGEEEVGMVGLEVEKNGLRRRARVRVLKRKWAD